MKAKCIKPVHVKSVFKSKEEPGGLISLKPKNAVKGCMQVPVVDFTESFLPFKLDT